MVNVLKGFGVGRGQAIGPVLHMSPPLADPVDQARVNPEGEEKAQAHRACALVSQELIRLGVEAGGIAEEILSAGSLMAQDPALLNAIDSKIDAGKTAVRAVFEAMASYRDLMSSMGGYMAERAGDLDDISQRIRAELLGIPAPGVPASTEPYILVTRDLSPADTATLDFTLVKALVTEEGGPTSHTAILARAGGLPAIVGVTNAQQIPVGTTVLVDAAKGEVHLNPSASQELAAQRSISLRAARQVGPTGPGRLSNGTAIQLLANLGSVAEVPQAKAAGCEGVGLFRTEFLFLDSKVPPTIEQQVTSYRELLANFPGQKVIVRLLDAGADKPLPYLTASEEENPALGLRGYRALRAHRDVLEDQLAALATAAKQTEAELWVMAPMITDVDETIEFTKTAKGHGLKMAGVMAEVPSVAIMADQIAMATDFLSIGTNDLTQYAMAADRLLGTVAAYQDPWHPAVLRLVQLLGDACKTAGRPLGVCGEASADPDLAAILVGLGVTSLSMTPSAISEVRHGLASVSLDQARSAALATCQASNAQDARRVGLEILYQR